jgi:O-antigen/teichoic acid export membrane protein
MMKSGVTTLIRGVPWASFEALADLGLTFVQVFLLARILGPEDFGSASTVAFVVSMAEILITTLFVEALIQSKTVDQLELDTAFSTMVILGILAWIGFILTADSFALAVGDPRVGAMVSVAGSSCILSAARAVPDCLLVRGMNFKQLAFRRIISKLVGTASSVLLSFAGFGPWSMIIGATLWSVTATTLAWRFYPRRPTIRFHRGSLLWMSKFGTAVAGEQMLRLGTVRVFVFSVGATLGVAPVAMINISLRLFDTLAFAFNIIVGRMVLPYFARLRDDSLQQMWRHYEALTRLSSLLFAPTLVALAWLSPSAVSLVLGVKWAPYAQVLAILCIGALLDYLLIFAPTLLKACGKPSLLAVPAGLSLIATLIAAASMPLMGLEAAVSMWVLRGVVYFVSMSIIVSKAGIPISRQLVNCIPSLTCCLVMVVAFHCIEILVGPPLTILAFCFEACVGGAVYMLSAILVERPLIIATVKAVRTAMSSAQG